MNLLWLVVRAVATSVCIVVDVVCIALEGCQALLRSVSRHIARLLDIPSPIVQIWWGFGSEQRLVTHTLETGARTETTVQGTGEDAGVLPNLHANPERGEVEVPSPDLDQSVDQGDRIAEPSLRWRVAARAEATREEHAIDDPAGRAERWRRLTSDAVNGAYYGVAVGKNPGVYTSWALAHAQVNKFSGSSHKVFHQLHLALQFIREHQLQVGVVEDITQYSNQGNPVAKWHFSPNPFQPEGLGNWHW
jgi:hypothetical protein